MFFKRLKTTATTRISRRVMPKLLVTSITLLIVCGAFAASACGAEPRAAVPATAQRQEITKQVRELYRAEYRGAEDDSDKRTELVGALRDTAKSSAKAERFVLLDEARRQAIAGGLAALATEIVAEMDRRFRINGVSVTTLTLQKVTAKVRSPEQKAETATAALATLDRAVAKVDIASAERLVAIAEQVTRRPATESLRAARKDVLERKKQLQPLLVLLSRTTLKRKKPRRRRRRRRRRRKMKQ